MRAFQCVAARIDQSPVVSFFENLLIANNVFICLKVHVKGDNLVVTSKEEEVDTYRNNNLLPVISNSTSSVGDVNLPLKVVVISLNVSLCVSQLKGAVTAYPLKTTLLLHTKLHALTTHTPLTPNQNLKENSDPK
ncbi:hypothetical protein E2C01_040457 [Portunus trituberculatus]|uniref:Uncharacterized protein n=1 Tax=Portunus trituberculatus TaxID=210409 RepID=A0A5B7FHI6_PORTR|nr:hypothetical protein [Portunus trituberculatus]